MWRSLDARHRNATSSHVDHSSRTLRSEALLSNKLRQHNLLAGINQEVYAPGPYVLASDGLLLTDLFLQGP